MILKLTSPEARQARDRYSFYRGKSVLDVPLTVAQRKALALAGAITFQGMRVQCCPVKPRG